MNSHPWGLNWRTAFPKNLILLAVALLQPIALTGCFSPDEIPPQAVQTEFPSGWNNVAVGGGGYVTGLYLHPQVPNLGYIRTDMGGFYRWDSTETRWIPLTDRFTRSESGYYGGEALALDPNNPDRVYIAAGKYLWAEPGTIFKSSDRGQTWVQSDLRLPMGGNEELRGAGNRLVVSPHNSNLLLFGSRENGLWRSIDAGMTWNPVPGFPTPSESKIGILAIAFDPNQANQIYASVYGDRLYESTDGGTTWNPLPNSPSHAFKLAVASDSTLYVTHAQGVSKYLQESWQNITPPNTSFRRLIRRETPPFNGLSIHPENPQELIVSHGETSRTQLYHSRDGGVTWTEKKSQINNTVPWWPDDYFSNHLSALEFDPIVPSRVWLSDWYGVWQTDNFNENRPVWTNYSQGHEQVVTFDLVSPPTGALLLSAVADVEGFYHSRLDEIPPQRFGSDRDSFQETYSLDYAAQSPKHLVRVGGDRWNSRYGGATSTDGGLTWQRFSQFPEEMMPMRVAVSATNPQQFVVTLSENQGIQTQDNGQSWQPVQGLPDSIKGPWKWSQPLAADAVNGNRFYYYHEGTVYQSQDGGLSFASVYQNLPESDWHFLKTMPGVEGEVWVSLDEEGLHRSPNGGQSFSKVAGVELAYLFAFGKAAPGQEVPALYLYGKVVNQPESIFWSPDLGETWINIGDPEIPIGNQPNVMAASKQQFGLVFVGTNGRGIYYRAIGDE
ncbi:BNR/Asp-box repeat-containing protein [Oscillatoria acuminata]|uniref:BNR/Asp-box repeat protein n=1 Tax=Oscillatoria acuminata PCC 6304 TaxID=56110 RepID=K9TH95_9CYAN|nr:BNR/Asp-box repeat-containing protein [Oscillatoria acuminata]AFY81910.1 BNR/Asp-box repeat protein [Oscillatoria acuminata PCC 6304]